MKNFYLNTKAGLLEVRVSGYGVEEILFLKKRILKKVRVCSKKEEKLAKQAKLELEEYFSGKRKKFSVKLHIDGSEFQKKVWRELCKVEYGKTITYGELALKAGYSGAARAIGTCMNVNKIPIIIPCHRVVGVSDKFKYGAGPHKKKKLMRLEGII